MEPNKLEKDFRKKLKQRTIAPSSKSWDRLNAMLTVAEEKKPKSNNTWLFIAASLIGFIGIGIVFFSQTQELIDVRRNEMVNIDTISLKKTNKIQNNMQETKPKTVLVSASKPIESKKVISIKTQPNEILENPQITTQNESLVTQNDSIITNEKQTVVAFKEETKPSIKVNPQQLLTEVDGELELSFREKVINTIDKNYKKVKLALAKQNQK